MLSEMKVLAPSTSCSADRFEKGESAIRSVWCPCTEACGWRFVVADFLLCFLSGWIPLGKLSVSGKLWFLRGN